MRRRALVIEDNPLDRELLLAFLDDTRFEVQIAEGGGLGISAAIARVPDVILLDLRLPDLDGYAVCRQLRLEPQTKQVPIVIVTASDDPALNRLAYAAGAQACLVKPFRKEALLTAIEAVLAGIERGKSRSRRGKHRSLSGEPKERAMVWESLGSLRGGLIWVKQLGPTAWTAAVTPLPQPSQDPASIIVPPDEMVFPEVFDSRAAAEAAAKQRIDRELDQEVQRYATEFCEKMGGLENHLEGRRFVRFPVFLPVIGLGSQSDQGEILGMVRNVSAGGLMVEFSVELVPGTALDLALLTHRGPLEVEARTVWTVISEGMVRHGFAFPQPKDHDFALRLSAGEGSQKD